MRRDDFTVGWICALQIELAASRAMLDHEYSRIEDGIDPGDDNIYSWGRIGDHKIVMACLPDGKYGVESAAAVAKDMLRSFASLRSSLMVGIGGGVPLNGHDIRLGDVVVSKPTELSGGVIQYDFGKVLPDGKFEQRRHLNKPPLVLLGAIQKLQATHEMQGSQMLMNITHMFDHYPRMRHLYGNPGPANDRVFLTDCKHQDTNCLDCGPHRQHPREPRENPLEPRIHYGLIGSGNKVISSVEERNKLCKGSNILCFETEASGLMDSFPCLVVRGICDYADAFKRDQWQKYAATTAAAYGRELLYTIPAAAVEETQKAKQITKQDASKATFSIGLQLGKAPVLEDSFFVGRASDLQVLEDYLLPTSVHPSPRIAVVAGLGGMGKTQLALRFAKRHSDKFTTVWWVDASSAGSLKNGFIALVQRVVELDKTGTLDLESFASSDTGVDADSEDFLFRQSKQWLSQDGNAGWLIIFDNYDDPNLPGIKSDTGYDIREFFPFTSHGSMLITTRSPRVQVGKLVLLQALSWQEEGLDLLARRSKRLHVAEDPDALAVAKRLNGLPLAIAAAGDYLNNCADTFADYLESYEKTWTELAEVTELADYEDRTLYSTWQLSFAQIEASSPDAGHILRFLAYFDNKEIDYNLLFKGTLNWQHKLKTSELPAWFLRLANSRIKFNAAMKSLQQYCFVDLGGDQRSYSLHNCVHDWALECLNEPLDQNLYNLAAHCVSNSCSTYRTKLWWTTIRKIGGHASRLVQHRIQHLGDLTVEDCRNQDKGTSSWLGYDVIFTDYHFTGAMLADLGIFAGAETMYLLALAGRKNLLGAKHEQTLDTTHNLGNLYSRQAKFEKARGMYLDVVRGKETVLGFSHPSTLDAVIDLGLVYRAQDMQQLAQECLERAWSGLRDSVGSESIGTMKAALHLGDLYGTKGDLDKAMSLVYPAVEGFTKYLGHEDIATLGAICILAKQFKRQGKLHDAEKRYCQALEGFNKLLGPKHMSTLVTDFELAQTYEEQGNLTLSSASFVRTLEGEIEVLGAEHKHTLTTKRRLAWTYEQQGRIVEAQELYMEVVQGRTNLLGPTHPDTLRAKEYLSSLLEKLARSQLEAYEAYEENQAHAMSSREAPSEHCMVSKTASRTRFLELNPSWRKYMTKVRPLASHDEVSTEVDSSGGAMTRPATNHTNEAPRVSATAASDSLSRQLTLSGVAARDTSDGGAEVFRAEEWAALEETDTTSRYTAMARRWRRLIAIRDGRTGR